VVALRWFNHLYIPFWTSLLWLLRCDTFRSGCLNNATDEEVLLIYTLPNKKAICSTQESCG
jgi:hypothetical protein